MVWAVHYKWTSGRKAPDTRGSSMCRVPASAFDHHVEALERAMSTVERITAMPFIFRISVSHYLVDNPSSSASIGPEGAGAGRGASAPLRDGGRPAEAERGDADPLPTTCAHGLSCSYTRNQHPRGHPRPRAAQRREPTHIRGRTAGHRGSLSADTIACRARRKPVLRSAAQFPHPDPKGSHAAFMCEFHSSSHKVEDLPEPRGIPTSRLGHPSPAVKAQGRPLFPRACLGRHQVLPRG